MYAWAGAANRAVLVVVLAATVSACDKADGTHAGAQQYSVEATVVAPLQNDAGHTLTDEFCSDCHVAPKPAVHSADEWPGVMARMLDNMRRGGKRSPDSTQIDTILDYLQANARS